MENRLPLRISLILVLAVVAAYFPVVNCDFVNFDDPGYVYNNTHVVTGLTPANIVWAWTSFDAANWHPLTWMSHQLDCQLFGLKPRPHHLVNLFWHIASTVGLYLVLRRMTGEDWRPALVAALFGLHPLHVESVAWISERKDVLSTFFAILTLGMYTLYAARPSLGRYLIVMASFAVGLLCKPMLVTWPCILLLMDYWPLRRTPLLDSDATCVTPRFVRSGWGRLVLEKLPLLALAVASSLVTMRAQALAMKPSENLGLGFRLGNAVVSYASYLRKMVWPLDLAAFYRHQGSLLQITPVIVSSIVLALLSLGVLLTYRRRPALLVGWLWYLGTLVPVIGLVQVGLQSMADRYTYIPLIGIFMALAWSIPPLPRQRPAVGVVACVATIGMVMSCAVLTFRQVQFWRNAQELWLRAVTVDGNPVTYSYYAGALYNKTGEYMSEAAELFRKGRTAEADRRAAEAQAYMVEAIELCKLALQTEPSFELARAQLGEYQVFNNDLDGALATLSEGVALDPQSSALHSRLGRVLAYLGRIEEACSQFREACRLDKAETAARHLDLGTALALLSSGEEAEREWEMARQLQPDILEEMRRYAESFLGGPYARHQCPAAAVFYAQEVCLASPTPQAELFRILAEAYAAVGRPIAAYAAAQRALALAEEERNIDLLSALRDLTRSYEPLARQHTACIAAAASTSCAIPALPATIETLALLESLRSKHQWGLGEEQALDRRANDR